MKKQILILGLTLAAAALLAGCVVRERPARVVVAPAPDAVVITEAPPPPQAESGSIAPSQNAVWIDGHWAWEGRWVWMRGHWEMRPHPGAVWVPGRWVVHNGGNVWIEGRWQY